MASPDPGLDLPPEQPVRRSLRRGESDVYRLPLAPGEVVDVQVEQDGVDVALILSGPGGEELLAVDTPKGNQGTEHLFDCAETGGMYRLQVRAAAGRSSALRGSYVLQRAKPRPAGPRDRIRAQAWREYSRGESLRRKGSGEGPRQALVHYGEASRLWRLLGSREQAATALYRSAWMQKDFGDQHGAAKTFEQALPLAEETELRLSILNALTILYKQLGDMERASQTGGEALELVPRAGNPTLQAAALNNWGTIYRSWGETDKALEYFDAALEKWREVGAHSERARTLSNRAEIVLAAGDPKSALQPLLEALRMQENLGDFGSQALTYRDLGVTFDRLGLPFTALGFLNLAREKARDTGDRWVEGLALNDQGSTLLNTERYEEALSAFQEAGRIARDGGNKDNEAYAAGGLGNVLLKQGDEAGALESFAHSEELYSELGDLHGLSTVLHHRALAERSLGRVEDSLASIDRALELVEELRDGVGQPDLRSNVIGARADLYDLRVDLLLRLHERTPDRGFDAQAFTASEWRRARSLLEQMKKLGAGIPRDLPAESLRRQEVLRVRLFQLTQEKLKIGAGVEVHGKRRNLSEIEREIDETLVQWRDLAEHMRRQSPAYAAITLENLVDVREVQALLDTDTALIAYTVGKERSIVWWIERDALEVHASLPPRAKLEALAADLYDLLSTRPKTRQRDKVENRLESLGKALLGPLGDRLRRVRRIAVVADESLQALPFAALPVPGSGEPLVESHAIVQLPSASLAAVLRARQEGRVKPPELMAGFGDPVFGPSDERFPQEDGRSRSAGDRRSELPRLPKSSREMTAIRKLVPPARSRWFLGFAANRRAAMDTDLARYRYIHFATHGFVDPENPNLSGIQLSPFDAQGEPLPEGGILPFYEIYNLRFPADLVTLSACRTVDGPWVRGEGRLGMSRSFLYAGATRVMGTLWNVEDADAAELMTSFYRALLQDGKPPAMALQEAQKAMRAREATRAPYHWAGFVLQGDWR